MERRPRQTPPPPGTFSVDATAALRSFAGRDEPPILLACHPSFVTNPYQTLLYGSVRESGFAPVRMVRFDQLDELEDLQVAGFRTVLHLHWLHLVLRDAATEREARRLSAAFLDRLDRYRARGGRIVWTVHNILPHDARFEDLEATLSGEVARRADVVHVLAARTAEIVAPHFELSPDRILHVPHPSYRGAYADHLSRLDARQELGLMPDELVLAVVGVIRPYKGLDELLDAWPHVLAGRPRRLLVAGAPADEPGIEALVERAALDARVIVDARKIPADEIQVFLRAADVAVFPYRRSLNSGALMLALTFGLPVIVPAGGGLEELVDPAYAVTFEPGDGGSLAAALERAPGIATPEASRAALARATQLDPAELSRRFGEGLRRMLEETPA